MLTPSTPVATPFSPDPTNTAKAATVEANARAAHQAQLEAGVANEARVADIAAAQTTARQAASAIPDPMASLSTVAVVGAMHSLPAALNMMQRIALASASGTLTDDDRQALHTEYAQLTARVVGSVGSVGAGDQAQTSTSHEETREDTGQGSRRENGGDRRTTMTQTREMPKQTVQYHPVERTVTTQQQTLVAALHGAAGDPPADVRTLEPHVGADAGEPATVHQSFSHDPVPEPAVQIESHPETRHAFVVQAAQITQFVQVAQIAQAAPPVAVA